jgi:hypothetical protein
MLLLRETIPEVKPEMYFPKAGFVLLIFGLELKQALSKRMPIKQVADSKRFVLVFMDFFIYKAKMYR